VRVWGFVSKSCQFSHVVIFSFLRNYVKYIFGIFIHQVLQCVNNLLQEFSYAKYLWESTLNHRWHHQEVICLQWMYSWICGATHLQIASLGAHHRRTAEPALAACPRTCRLQSCRAHVQGLKRHRAAVPVVGFYPCCQCVVSTSTPLGVHQPTAGDVPSYRRSTIGRRAFPIAGASSCLERSSIWRYVCSVAGRLWTALEDRTFSPLLQCCRTVSSLIVVLEMDLLFRPL